MHKQHKTCSKCNITKELKEFNKHSGCYLGYNSKCKECISIYKKDNYIKNKEKILKRVKNYSSNNKDNISKKFKKYYLENKDTLKEKSNEHYVNNKEQKLRYQKEYQTTHKKQRNTNIQKRMNYDVVFRLSCSIRKIIHAAFKYNKFNKNNKTEEIIGCSFKELKVYLESKFEPWMCWNNKGLYNSEFNYGWDIDHIIPISTAKTTDDVIKLNHYTNLQPLCSKINRDIKRNKLTYKDSI